MTTESRQKETKRSSMPKQHGGFQTGLGAPGALGEFHVQIASMRELGSCVHIKIGKIGEIGADALVIR